MVNVFHSILQDETMDTWWSLRNSSVYWSYCINILSVFYQLQTFVFANFFKIFIFEFLLLLWWDSLQVTRSELGKRERGRGQERSWSCQRCMSAQGTLPTRLSALTMFTDFAKLFKASFFSRSQPQTVKKKMDDTSPLPSTVEKWRQNT